MAKEIVIVEADQAGLVTAAFLYPISTAQRMFVPVGDSTSTVLAVPAGTPGVPLSSYLSSGELSSIAVGTMAWESVRLRLSTMTSEAATSLKKAYDAYKADYLKHYQQRYAFAGVRITPNGS